MTEAGVRKQWKKLYEAASVADDDFAGQCRVVHGVMKDLGFTGKGSIEQAKKIREEREFADELAALQENPVLDDDVGRGGRPRRTRASVGSAGSSKRGGGRNAITVSDDSDDEDQDESDFEEVPARKAGKKANNSTSSARARGGSDNTDDSEDEGPTRRVSITISPFEL